VSVSNNGRPVGEGDCRTTHMHAGEESDSGVVPMKQPNNEGRPQRGQPEAEAVEGSPLTEENAAQPNAGRTQRRATVCSGLSRVRQAAPRERQLRADFSERSQDAMHPRQEPYAAVPHVRICAGGEQQCSSLPRPISISHSPERDLRHVLRPRVRHSGDCRTPCSPHPSSSDKN